MEESVKSKHSLIADYYTKHYDELKLFVFSRLQNADEAEDVVQNIFVRLLQSEQMISALTLPSLVYTMARNMIIDFWRRRHQYEKYEYFIQKSSLQDSSVDDVESIFSAHEVTEMLEQGIARLTETQSRVYRLNIYEGMQVKQIATVLQISYKSAEKRLGAARKKVRGFVAQSLAG